MKLNIFEQHKRIEAYFSQKPLIAAELIPQLCKEAEERGGIVAKAGLVHGKDIAAIRKEIIDAAQKGASKNTLDGNFLQIPETDGLITDLADVALVTTHGDCIPLYAYDPVKNVIGVAHAGWKGTKLGIAFELIKAMEKEYGCSPSDIEAYIGPGIDFCCFAVKDDVADQFYYDIPWADMYIRQKNFSHYLIDLKGINREFFNIAGCFNVETSDHCTVCREDLYWSYRREKDMNRMITYMRIKL